jgi:phosphatidylglycerophosphate synthase
MINFNTIRKKMYKEVYSKHSATSKIAKFMVYQPINTWGKNIYIKLKYYFIIEIACLISWFSIKFKINPNSLSILNVFLAFTAFILLCSTNKYFNYLALILFFSKNILDYADGFVARNQNRTSATGAFLDEWSGIVFYFFFYFSIPIYVFQKTENVIYLFIAILMFFFQLLNPKNFILSNRFLSSLDIRKRKKILTTFYSIQSLKNKKNFYFKEKVIKFFSLLDYSGGTRYTDLVILILIIEIYNSSLILTPAICVLWSLLIISKFVYFKLKIIENLK